MSTHFIHLVLAGLLLSTVLMDVFLLRSPSSEAIEPRELILKWRKLSAIAEMILVIIVLALGLSMWMPLIKAYPPAIFHTKFILVLVFVLLGKIRMLKERKKGVQIGLTRAMAAILFVVFCLGAAGGLA